MPADRDDIARHVRTAFIGGAAARTDLIALAKAGHAPDDVVHALRDLPDRRFGHLYEIWDYLPALPAASVTPGAA